ncbi:hypothetical protein [Caldivirga maquilingensis]|uniref:hypothetical protein n=1 Tax=Caldivirga maquilingensis TaxID=76887 RepID=UPI0000F24AFE|nr:hypothetical protein [Caldivirga maquilingensis]
MGQVPIKWRGFAGGVDKSGFAFGVAMGGAVITWFTLWPKEIVLTFLQVMLVMTGMFYCSWSMFNYFVGILTETGLPGVTASFFYAIAGLIDAISIWFTGLMSDFIGRRLAIIIAGIGSAIMALPSFYILYLGGSLRSSLLL